MSHVPLKSLYIGEATGALPIAEFAFPPSFSVYDADKDLLSIATVAVRMLTAGVPYWFFFGGLRKDRRRRR